MKLAVAALALLTMATPAAACLPPLPGAPAPKPPTDAEMATMVDRGFAKIIDGVVLRGTDRRGVARFRVINVYRGDLKRGQVIALTPGPSLRSMNPCPGMVPDYVPPLRRGDRGVIGWYDVDRAQFIDPPLLEAMIAAGYVERLPAIAAPRSATARSRRSAPTRSRRSPPTG